MNESGVAYTWCVVVYKVDSGVLLRSYKGIIAASFGLCRVCLVSLVYVITPCFRHSAISAARSCLTLCVPDHESIQNFSLAIPMRFYVVHDPPKLKIKMIRILMC